MKFELVSGPSRWLRRIRAGTMVLAFALPACVGLVGGEPSDGALGTMPESSRFPRLSHEQWENTVMDLLKLDAKTGLTASFTGDTLSGFFDNNAATLSVPPPLWADYQRAAEELSKMVVNDPAKLDKILPAAVPGQDDTARAKAFIETFGKHAYRRPLSSAEVNTYLGIFAQGKDILASGNNLNDGLTLVLQGFLQSPHFLYRVERSVTPREDRLIPLNGWEIATRLSYALWGTMPDDMLLADAEAGTLSTREGVKAVAERLLQDPRARDVTLSFHRQLFRWDHYNDIYKDAAAFPEFVPEIRDDVQREAELFVDDVMVQNHGGLNDLLTSRVTYVNQRLASLYGLPGTFDNTFMRVELPAAERSGALTRIGFLASNATARISDPIHRGVFINYRVLCAQLPPPPNNVTPLPPQDGQKTTRDVVDGHTGAGTCGATCHGTLINPVGFAFENYDAMGRFRTEDNGFPVNAADSYVLDGARVSYTDAATFSTAVSESLDAHRCWTQNLLAFTYGRKLAPEDQPTVERLAASSREGMSLQDLMIELCTSDAFLTRRPVEAP